MPFQDSPPGAGSGAGAGSGGGRGGRWRLGVLAALGLMLVGGTLAAALVGDVRRGEVSGRVWTMVVLLEAQFAVLLAALAVVPGLVRRPALHRPALVVVLAVAFLCRAILIPARPNLSDDLHRYVWEGFVQWRGINPYLTSPAEVPPGIRTHPVARLVTHTEVPAIYPPLTELTFRLLYPVARTARGYRVAMVLFDLGTMLLLVLLLRSMGCSPLWVTVYAWHPLVIMEFAGGGHFDAMGLFWMVLAVYLLRRGRGLGAWVALGLAVAAKYIPAPLALFFWPRTRRWQSLAALAVVLALASLYLPGGLPGLVEDDLALLGGRDAPNGSGRIFTGLFHFLRYYDSNAGIHRAVLWLTGEEMSHDPVARAVMALLLAGMLVGLALARPPLETAGLYALGAVVVFSRIIHPWYATWVIPWLVLVSARKGTVWKAVSAGWLFFTGTIATSYVVLIRYVATLGEPEPVWEVPAWSMALQFAPLVAFWGLALAGHLRSRRRSDPGVRRGTPGLPVEDP